MNYYLVDFENVKTDGLEDMKGVGEGDSMIIFYSENCKSITLDVIDSIILSWISDWEIWLRCCISYRVRR